MAEGRTRLPGPEWLSGMKAVAAAAVDASERGCVREQTFAVMDLLSLSISASSVMQGLIEGH